ncbi:nitrile hydratase subunit beta [Streptomyces sp. NBC_01016]|uniref:SH3-like domain-containing protein n=1 Tax=Streptomyces sp. NBC_01016 TaxID=2903720 RepID=UPI002259124B|nr:SH3-like domain-containing protein [Streptomyces sp. NBC_01016]MCX4827319.1 nitrile hydratase subunit beta [Streptomyces sp. NBC_01016]
MSDSEQPAYVAGDLVRTYRHDPPHHTRLPRYARGKLGVVVEPEGRAPLADVRAQGRGDAPVEMVYAVRFAARELWGEGEHDVVLDLSESYLRKAEGDVR